MKVFKVGCDASRFQWISPDMDEDEDGEYLFFECKSKIKTWKNIDWYVLDPRMEKGNFYYGGPDCLMFDEHVYNSTLFPILEMSGEILPISLEEESLYALNILECVDALDHQCTRWNYYDDGSKRFIQEFVFHPSKIPASSLFKIPEHSSSDVLVSSGIKSPNHDFKTVYEQLGFTGLDFEELWRSP